MHCVHGIPPSRRLGCHLGSRFGCTPGEGFDRRFAALGAAMAAGWARGSRPCCKQPSSGTLGVKCNFSLTKTSANPNPTLFAHAHCERKRASPCGLPNWGAYYLDRSNNGFRVWLRYSSLPCHKHTKSLQTIRRQAQARCLGMLHHAFVGPTLEDTLQNVWVVLSITPLIPACGHPLTPFDSTTSEPSPCSFRLNKAPWFSAIAQTTAPTPAHNVMPLQDHPIAYRLQWFK